MQTVIRRLIVHGHVQGVGFRNTLEHRARKIGVSGWVRNRGDGTVEALVRGTETQIRALVEWARHGPPLARVERIELLEADETVDGDGFVRRPTV